MKETQNESPSYRVLGVRVDAMQIPEVCARIEQWIKHRDRCRYVAVTGMHGIMEAQRASAFKAVLNAADLVVPDGMPLVWLGTLTMALGGFVSLFDRRLRVGAPQRSVTGLFAVPAE